MTVARSLPGFGCEMNCITTAGIFPSIDKLWRQITRWGHLTPKRVPNRGSLRLDLYQSIFFQPGGSTRIIVLFSKRGRCRADVAVGSKPEKAILSTSGLPAVDEYTP